MHCVKCSTPNDDKRKFCRTCGAVLGLICERCKALNSTDDKYCGHCGLALDPERQGEVETPGLSDLPTEISRQYTMDEIHEFLELRKLILQSQETKNLTQDDLNKLFD